jgi:peptidylprolyl isomerase
MARQEVRTVSPKFRIAALPLAALALVALTACADETSGGGASKPAAATTAAKPKPKAAAPSTSAPAAAATPATSSAGEEHVLLDTTAGPILIDLYEDKCPGHAENFKKLVKQGYYDNSPFHRVIEGFMAQGGGHWREGSPGGVDDVGYTIPAEIVPGRLKHVRGSVAAARTNNPERKSSGSQFYICFAPAPFLDDEYTVFGEVLSGMENVDKIVRGAPGSGAVDPAKATVIKTAKLVPATVKK